MVKERSFRIMLIARAQWDAAGAGSWAPSWKQFGLKARAARICGKRWSEMYNVGKRRSICLIRGARVSLVLGEHGDEKRYRGAKIWTVQGCRLWGTRSDSSARSLCR